MVAREALAACSGVVPVRSAAAWSSWSTRSVWMRPGSTTFTVTPCEATSAASVFDQPTTAERMPFDSASRGIGCSTPEEAMVMMRP